MSVAAVVVEWTERVIGDGPPAEGATHSFWLTSVGREGPALTSDPAGEVGGPGVASNLRDLVNSNVE